ncbi:histone-lysine N-methyltransferase ASH1L-like isoform X1 [Anneissia japonica]|nr:histone-lysine N-methyltransferase ASH1L-like isoform X1 [Anneissia japonica]
MTTNSKHIRSIMGTKSVADSTGKEDGQKASKDDEEEEVIRCLCGLLNDEGLMIQCDKCMVWQHFDCIGLPYDKEPDHYICELCKPREVAEEIKMTPQPKYAQPGQTYYLCLTREDGTRVKMGDCAYLPRTQEGSNTPTIVPSNTNGHSTHIIFRVEQLWKNDKGERFAFGHHFLRPHETHHTPSRKFFQNELFRGPFYEIIRLDLIIGFCCVMDLYTYCKGRPKNFKEEDIYICEYRLDKTAHLFHPISKNKFPICTKSYAFNKFDKKIIPKRDYSPHYVPEHYKRGYGGRPTWKCNRDKTDENVQQHEPNKKWLNKQEAALKRMRQSLAGKRNALKNNNNRQQKQKRVNAISQGLLDKLPGKQPVDLTFLLECPGKRQRKKPVTESFI